MVGRERKVSKASVRKPTVFSDHNDRVPLGIKPAGILSIRSAGTETQPAVAPLQLLEWPGNRSA